MTRLTLLRWTLLLAALGTVAFAGISAVVLWRGRSYISPAAEAPHAQTAIVLGALVFPDGAVSDMLADRHVYRDQAYYDLREAAARVKAFGSVLVHRRPVFLGPAIPISGDGRATHDL